MTGHLCSVAMVEPGSLDLSFLPQQASSRRLRNTRLRVLVVDDEMRIADTITEVLQQAGFEAEAAYTGEMALALAARFQPDCLLSDIVMPRMNGVDLAVAFRDAFPGARVVLISGQVGISEILDEAERRGLEFELLSKPIHPSKLIEELRKTRSP